MLEGGGEVESAEWQEWRHGAAKLWYDRMKLSSKQHCAAEYALKIKQVVWCGVVWCGVVWCGVVWCGVVWCGVVWCGVVWCGVVYYQLDDGLIGE